jgi:transcriptional regulator with GAF, ATPase, and Fis domain
MKGALQDNKYRSYFEVADGGTIFLDEVGELPLTTQVRLRVLENGEFIKGVVPSSKKDVRIVAATNVNLFVPSKREVQGRLVLRLSTVDILLPPLRDRKMIFIYFSENLQPTLLTNTKCLH